MQERSQPNPVRAALLPWALIAIAAVAAYANTLRAPFLFDDFASITRNATIRDLTAISTVLSPPSGGQGVSGRPVVNLSLALNYAIGGTRVEGYHIANALAHASVALLLFGVLRRTLRMDRFRAGTQAAADSLALVVTLVWVLHPLQTESVTCVIQRTEVLVAFFYALTLHAFLRGVASERGAWLWVSVAAAAIGMATKEVMVTAPVLVLAYDRTFVSGTFARALRVRKGYYVGLFSTWLVLALLLVRMGGTRGVAAGIGVGVSWWTYLLTQAEALVRYVGLAIWPAPLVLDYGTSVVTGVADIAPQGVLVIVTLAATGWAFWRRSAAGFAGLAFFVILAPSSSVVPLVAQTMAEHRMYLPLAALVAMVTVGLFERVGRGLWVAATLVCVGLGALTVARNALYLNPVAIWADTVAKRPENGRAHSNYGNGLVDAGQLDAGIEQYMIALKYDPAAPETHASLAGALLSAGRPAEAEAHCRAALAVSPNQPAALNNMSALTSDPKVALEYARRALEAQRDFPEAHVNVGVALVQLGDVAGGINELDTALRLRPDLPSAHFALGAAVLQQGDIARAKGEFEAALRARAQYAEAEDALGTVLLRTGDLAGAIVHCRRACELKPTSAQFRGNLGAALLQADDATAAVDSFRVAVSLAPDELRMRLNLAAAYFKTARFSEAVGVYREAARLWPDSVEVRQLLETALRAEQQAAGRQR